jgi:hypothetical protein
MTDLEIDRHYLTSSPGGVMLHSKVDDTSKPCSQNPSTSVWLTTPPLESELGHAKKSQTAKGYADHQ